MSYAEVEPDEVRARIARGEDVFLLDVREPDEVEEWAYPIGVNIPLDQLRDRLDEVPRDVTVVVACHMGGRSATAAKALSDAGWTTENLTGYALGLGGRRARHVRTTWAHAETCAELERRSARSWI